MQELMLQDPWGYIIRILFSAFLGALIGLERGIHGQAAGLRTHILVCAGSTVFMILSTRVAEFGIIPDPNFTRVTDPGRIAAQIVTGIGFLGAGAIIKEGFTVRGLTTAASLWITASIGMACGADFFGIAIVTTMVALFALVVLHNVEKLYPKDAYRDLKIIVPLDVDVNKIIESIRARQINILFFDYTRDYEAELTTLKMSLRYAIRGRPDKLSHGIIEELEKNGVPMKSVTWSHN